MAAWLSFLPILGVALVAASWLSVARWAAHRLATDEVSIPRYLVWWLGVLGGVAGLVLAKSSWVFALGGAALAFWILLGSAVEIRGSERRGKLATLQLYVAVFLLAQQYLRSRGWIAGTGAAPAHALAIESEIVGLIVPVAGAILGKLAPPSWVSPAGIAAHVAEVVAHHYLFALALASLALVAFAIAYLADRPLPALGLDLLPEPGALSAGFGVLVIVGWVLPSGLPATVVGLVVAGLCPFYVAEAAALLARWLSPLRSRYALIASLIALALALPFVGALVVFLGWVAQLARLRELLPFAALTETPMRRPRLVSLLWLSLGITIVFGASAALGKRGLGRASPALGAGPELCSAMTSSVDWNRGMVTFDSADTHFSMDVEETPAPPSAAGFNSLSRVCARQGKRLCSSDEWYIACLCTYPLDAEAGTKWWTNQLVAARAAEEHAGAEPALGVTTRTSEKQSEVRDLLAGRSEVVGAELAGAALLAGPNDASSDPWSVDCRARAWFTPSALTLAPLGSIGVRCCQ